MAHWLKELAQRRKALRTGATRSEATGQRFTMFTCPVPMGTFVELRNIAARPELNGAMGRVVGFKADPEPRFGEGRVVDRYVVQLDSVRPGTTIALKPEAISDDAAALAAAFAADAAQSAEALAVD